MKKPIGESLRRAVSGDLLNLIELDQAFFPQPWSEESWNDILLVPSQYSCLILESGAEVIGFCLFGIDAKRGHLIKLLVAPRYRSHGHGKHLLQEGIRSQGFEEVYLEVSVLNSAAISLYRELGFEVLILKNKFYSNGDDAFAMLLKCE